MGIINYTSFLLTSFLFVLSPGIDTLYIVNKSVTSGKRTAVFSSFGIICGVFVHIALATFGVGVFLSKSPLAFNVIKGLGAVYLIYLGVAKLFAKTLTFNTKRSLHQESELTSFLAGAVTSVLNPKIIIFLIAFIPPFVAPAVQPVIPFLLLGLTYATMKMLWLLVLAYSGEAMSNKFQNTYTLARGINIFTAMLFILVGIKLANA